MLLALNAMEQLISNYPCPCFEFPPIAVHGSATDDTFFLIDSHEPGDGRV